MRKVWELFSLDWKRIFKSKAATLLMLALLVIPSLYCWFNVWALWDPYTNTSGLKVAVYSADEATRFQKKKIAIGNELIAELKENKKLGWTFVDSKKEVEQGVKRGDYYAGIYVPKTFSKNLLSFVDGKIEKPTLKYYVNEKINAVAPKLTGTGASTLQSTISTEFQSTVGNTLMSVFNKAGIELDHNLPMLRRFASLITTTNQKLPEITHYIESARDLQAEMPAIKAKVAQVNDFMGYIPAVNALAQKVVGANQYLPMVDEAGQIATVAAGKIPEIKQAGAQMAAVDQNWAQLSGTLDKTLGAAKEGLTVLDDVDAALPKIMAAGEHAEDAAKTAKDKILPTLKQALPPMQQAITSGLVLLTNLNDRVAANTQRLSQYLQALQDDPDNQAAKQALNELLGQMQTDMTTGAGIATHIATTLTSLQDMLTQLSHGKPTLDFTPSISRLQNIAQVLRTASRHAGLAQDALGRVDLSGVQAQLNALSQVAGQFSDLDRELQNSKLPAQVTELNAILTKLLENATVALEDINTAVLPKLPSLLGDAKSIVTTGIKMLTKVQAQLPAVKQELHDANALLNGHMAQITKGITTAASLYQNDYPRLKQKLQLATGFIQNDLPGLENELTATVAELNAKLPLAEQALTEANQLIDRDWPTLKMGIQKGAAAVEKGEESVDFNQLIKLLKRDANKEASFLAQPVTLTTTSFYGIPTYGSASAPFYTALCLWVGGLLLASVVVTDYALDEEQKKRYGAKARFTGRFLTFAIMGILQATIVALGNMFLIHAYVAEPVAFVLATIFLDLVFMGILYALVGLFGNIGKGLGIIILVLSISGAGGNFPIQLSGRFFQVINPWLPFTYAVNLLRETVGGIYWPHLWQDVAVLSAYGIGFLLLGLFLKKPLEPIMTKIHDNAKISQIIH